MKNRYLWAIALVLLLGSCSKEDVLPTPKHQEDEESSLTAYQKEVIEYFKAIALESEFSNDAGVTRRWKINMKVFVQGNRSKLLLDEYERIRKEINSISTSGFKITTVNSKADSNYRIFFGSAQDYIDLIAKDYGKVTDFQKKLIKENDGLFTYRTYNNYIIQGIMYINTAVGLTENEQKHLLREELTQSLGLAKDSYKYPKSIFQQDWTSVTEYAPIDKELIRLLYHPQMKVGLNAAGVEKLLKKIYDEENKE